MFLLGVLAFFQITVIPGAIILKASNFRGTTLQKIIYGFALSLMASYCLIFILTVVHLYNQFSALIILVVELMGLAWFYRKDLQTPFLETLQIQYILFPKRTPDAIKEYIKKRAIQGNTY